MTEAKKAYDEILKVLKKYKDVCVFNIRDLEEKAELHLYGLQLQNEYGLNINPKEIYSINWVKFGDYRAVAWWGEKHNRTISWSVDGRQPKDDLLLQISFPTGAYIFGQDYPVALFQKFWLELKAFAPDYIDEQNHCLYWEIKNAKTVFNSFDALMRKYYEINKTDAVLRRIEKAKMELEELEKLK